MPTPQPLQLTVPAWREAAVAALVFLVTLATATAADAATYSCSAGDVACLIQSIEAANADGGTNTILLSAGTYTLTAPYTGPVFGKMGLPQIDSTLTIRGEGASDTVIERDSQAEDFRLLTVASGGLTIEHLTLRGGGGQSAVLGGALYAFGPLTVRNAILTDNRAREGGAIHALSSVTITDSTISGNTAVEGGGIFVGAGRTDVVTSTLASNVGSFGGAAAVRGGGVVSFTNCTLTANRAVAGGAINEGIPPDALFNIPPSPGTAIVESSTLAGNFSSQAPFSGRVINRRTGTIQVRGTILADNLPLQTGDCPQIGTTSLGFNLVESPNASFPTGPPTDCSYFLQPSDLIADPLLAAFVDEGAPGRGYFPLTAGSPAIDAGGQPKPKKKSECPTTDQIGQKRSHRCDIGAIEFHPDRVTIRQARYDPHTHVLFVTAGSTAVSDGVSLVISVPGCLTDAAMLQLDRSFFFLSELSCGNLEGSSVVVSSTGGGSATATIH